MSFSSFPSQSFARGDVGKQNAEILDCGCLLGKEMEVMQVKVEGRGLNCHIRYLYSKQEFFRLTATACHLRLTLEYVFYLFLSVGCAAVVTNVSQCGLTMSQFFNGPTFGPEGYVKPWHKGDGNERFIEYCESCLVPAGIGPQGKNEWCRTVCWTLP